MGVEIELEDSFDEAPVEITKKEVTETTVSNVKELKDESKLVSCLRNERVIVKFIPKEGGLVTDPKHILYGGLGVNSKRRFVVPVLQSGTFINILTNQEKDYLEHVMGLPDNSLSVYLKRDNFWSNRGVTLGKEKAVLDLSDPDDYIKYKILLANKDFIAPSEEVLRQAKKATYQFVIVREGEEARSSVDSLNTSAKAYILFGELRDDLEKLALIVEIGTGKSLTRLDKVSVFAQVEKFIKDNPKKFIEGAEDDYLDTKLLIKKAVNAGYIRKRGQYYYFTEDNSPLCNDTQEPTLQSACAYLNSPKYQEKAFALQAKIKEE